MLRSPVRHGFVRHGGGAARLAALGLCVACAGGTGRAAATPAPDAAAPLPPIPRATGPLALQVRWPLPNALVAARDSTFVFGATGHGDAAVTVNGAPVAVRPNGAWLAWVAMPPRGAPRFEVVATLPGGASQRVAVPIRLPAARAPIPAGAIADSASLQPRPGLALRDDEPVRVALRVAPGARAALLLPAADSAAGEPAGLPLLGDEETVARELPAAALRRGARLRVVRGADTLRLAVPAVAAGDSLGLVRLGSASDSTGEIVARPVPGGTYKWFVLPGTVLRATGRQGEWLRVRLDRQLDVWVEGAQATRLPDGSAEPRRVVGNARLVPAPEHVELVLPVAARPAWRVEAEGTRLRLTLHGATADADIVALRPDTADPRRPLVRALSWTNDASDRAVFTLDLAEPPYGWEVRWREGALVLRLRRAPRVDPAAPLAGLRIAVDAGHPPQGSTGPTGLYEGEVTLAVAGRVRALLEARGATAVMTRTTPDAVALGARQPIARRANAHAFVSIHLNALPDGVNPAVVRGSGTYWFNASSASLAQAIQARVAVRLVGPDNGTFYDNLAVLRPAWMPSVLVEGAYLIDPEQEAALRTEAYRERYALAIVEGLEAWFASLGAAQRAAAGAPR